MGKRMWRAQGERPVNAGDVFGDFQVGNALVVTYKLDEAPRARVSVYFGVVGTPDKCGVGLDPKGRYAPISKMSLELLDGTSDANVVDEVETDGHAFLLDYEQHKPAHMDAVRAAQEWQSSVWTINELFNGKEVHDGT